MEFAKVNYNDVRPLETRVLSFSDVFLFPNLHIIKDLSEATHHLCFTTGTTVTM